MLSTRLKKRRMVNDVKPFTARLILSTLTAGAGEYVETGEVGGTRGGEGRGGTIRHSPEWDRKSHALAPFPSSPSSTDTINTVS